MIVVVGVLVAAASVVLTRGRLSALAGVRVRLFSAIVAALAIQIVIIDVIPGRWPGIHPPLHVLSYLLAGAFLFANRRIPGLVILALGGSLNFAAIMANGGMMPASASALARSGRTHAAGDFLNSGVVPDAQLPWLGDIFFLPKGIPFANVFSIGDVLIVFAAFYGLHRICRARQRPWQPAVRPADLPPAAVGAATGGYRRSHGSRRALQGARP